MAFQADLFHDDRPSDKELFLAVLGAIAAQFLKTGVGGKLTNELLLFLIGKIGQVERIQGSLAEGILWHALAEEVERATGHEGGRACLKDEILRVFAHGRRERVARIIATGLAEA